MDNGRNPPLFGHFRSSDGNPPAPLTATHYRDAICVAAWSESPEQTSNGTLSDGGEIVRFAD
jgi:hypothetical protein